MASNKRDLKAFIRYDGTGRAIAGSLILQRKKPKVGNWVEIAAYECCNPTTSSTTTVAPGPYTFSLGFGNSSAAACAATPTTYYSLTSTIAFGNTFYTDAACTIPVDDGYYCLSCPNATGVNFFLVNSFFGGAGKVFSTSNC